MTLRTLNYGNYSIFLIMGNARFISPTVGISQASRWYWHLLGHVLSQPCRGVDDFDRAKIPEFGSRTAQKKEIYAADKSSIYKKPHPETTNPKPS